MSFFDVAEAAVEAALDAGARYADARVMHRRYESMTARNGEIEELSSDEDAGIGVRALVGSSWGFYAVPDLSDGAARRGRRAARTASPRPARGSPGRPSTWCRPTVSTATWASECEIDPLAVPLSDKGDLLHPRHQDDGRARRRPGRGRSTRSGTPASGSSPARATASTSTSASAARASRPPRSATARPSAAPTRRYRGQYGTRGWELVAGLDLLAHAAADRRGGPGAADRAAVPVRRDRR